MTSVNIGLLGLGTVGGGTVNVLTRNRAEIERRTGQVIHIRRASVRDLDRQRICPIEGFELTTDPFAIVGDDTIDVVVELIGGTDLARDLVFEAIASGKHVVTANKALVALHGNEILYRARKRGVIVAFEAAVAGGIPIIKAIREGLSGNRIESIVGIINGTGNFILTEMRDHGRKFSEALRDAQRLGYAEADPTMDIGGIDAAHKLAILGSMAFGIPLQFEQVYIEGIANIMSEDVIYAERLGYRIKHLGIARRRKEGIELRVHPTLIPEKQMLAAVSGVMNAVLVHANAVGPTLYYGAGAGAEPTASAIVADLIDVVRTLTIGPEYRVPHLAFQPGSIVAIPVLASSEFETAFYLRLSAADRPGVLAQITTVIGEAGISIEAAIQPEPPRNVDHANLILITHRVREAQMMTAIQRLEGLAVIQGKVTHIRLEHLDY